MLTCIVIYPTGENYCFIRSSATALSPRMDQMDNILTSILIPLLRYAADSIGSTIFLAVSFSLLMMLEQRRQ